MQFYIRNTLCYIPNTPVEIGFKLAIRNTTSWRWNLMLLLVVILAIVCEFTVLLLESDCEVKFSIKIKFFLVLMGVTCFLLADLNRMLLINCSAFKFWTHIPASSHWCRCVCVVSIQFFRYICDVLMRVEHLYSESLFQWLSLY